MKKLFIIISVALSVTASAQTRVLTTQEREALKNNTEFISECYWAVLNQANFFAGQTGATTFATDALFKARAEERLMGKHIIRNGITFQAHRVTEIFLDASKGKQYTVGEAPDTVENLIAQWRAENSFEEFVHSYFNLWRSSFEL